VPQVSAKPLGSQGVKIICMEEKSITLKPSFWRLFIWQVFPLLIILAILALFVNRFIAYWLPSTLGVLTAGIIITIIQWFSGNLEIEISNGKISGPSPGPIWRRQKFLIKELDQSSLRKTRFYQKIFGRGNLSSTRGETIRLTNFIYERSAIDELHKILSYEQAQFKK
jgi:hypothetical protein